MVKEIIDEIEKELAVLESIGIEYTEGAYSYYKIKDCFGNEYILQKLQRMTRWQWRVICPQTKQYYEISGSKESDFETLWDFLNENRISLSPN